MTDSISNNVARFAQASMPNKTALDQTQAANKQTLAASTTLDAAGKNNTPTQASSVTLSNVAQKVMAQPSFDRAKVDSIKKALKEGTYPINPRKIAENFVSLEQMIQG
jgi:negative regulator of flagellin synthesis FlgM